MQVDDRDDNGDGGSGEDWYHCCIIHPSLPSVEADVR